MKVLRTPDARFDALPDYPFSPNYLEVGNELRMHYVDEGPRDAPVVLLLHGEPTWSYLYRKMIPPIAAGGFRVIAPDLIGFGKSDKPAKIGDYSYASHEQWLMALLDALELNEITLFGQDWGSLLGLRIAGLHPDRFARIMIANGMLPIGEGEPPFAFKLWRAFSKYSPVFPLGRIVQGATVTELSAAEVAAYDAPFPSSRFKAGARAFPALVPVRSDDPAVPTNRRAWEGLGKFQKPFLCVFGKNDPILGSLDGSLIDHVPGAKNQPHERIWGGHFVQEDRGDELARRLVEWAS
jgi:haloalkane dehalogenase